MGQEDASKEARYCLFLSPEEEAPLVFYTTQTSLLWNAMVHAMQTSVRAYLLDPRGEAAEQVFLESALRHYKALDSDVRFLIPKVIRDSRLMDFVNACQMAKKKYLENPSQPPPMPARKSRRSNRMVRFPRSEITLAPGVITVNLTPKVVLPVPGFHPSQVSESADITVSSRFFAQDKIEPGSQALFSYKLTFVQ